MALGEPAALLLTAPTGAVEDVEVPKPRPKGSPVGEAPLAPELVAVPPANGSANGSAKVARSMGDGERMVRTGDEGAWPPKLWAKAPAAEEDGEPLLGNPRGEAALLLGERNVRAPVTDSFCNVGVDSLCIAASAAEDAASSERKPSNCPCNLPSVSSVAEVFATVSWSCGRSPCGV